MPRTRSPEAERHWVQATETFLFVLGARQPEWRKVVVRDRKTGQLAEVSLQGEEDPIDPATRVRPGASRKATSTCPTTWLFSTSRSTSSTFPRRLAREPTRVRQLWPADRPRPDARDLQAWDCRRSSSTPTAPSYGRNRNPHRRGSLSVTGSHHTSFPNLPAPLTRPLRRDPRLLTRRKAKGEGAHPRCRGILSADDPLASQESLSLSRKKG
jgi:hypothetical protein